MRKVTIRTIFDDLISPIQPGGISRTLFFHIKWTITKQTVKIPRSLVTGKILTLSVRKKLVGILHILTPVIISLFLQILYLHSTKPS